MAGMSHIDVDPDVYLREDVSMALTEYTAAQKIIDNFRNQLSPEQKERFESCDARLSSGCAVNSSVQ